MTGPAEFLAAHGPMLLFGTTALLSTGTIVLLLQRSPIHRQRVAEMSVLGVLMWVVLACIPMRRWSPAANVPSFDRASVPLASDTSGATGSQLPSDWQAVLAALIRPPPSASGRLSRNDLAEPAAATVAASDSPPTPAPATSARPSQTHSVRANVVVALAYVAGAAGCAGWLLLGHVVLWRLIRGARLPEDWLAELFASACKAIGVRNARILVVCAPLRPASYGMFRPTVLLGPDCFTANYPRLRQVLLHEAAHLRQRDAWGNALFNLAMPLLYFHPLYWVLRSRASLAREMVADDIAAAGTSRATYAMDLIELARARVRYSPTPLTVLGVFRSPSHFYRRMHMLMQHNARLQNRCSLAWKLASAIACAGVIFAASATLGVRRAAAQDAPKAAETKQDQTDVDRKTQDAVAQKNDQEVQSAQDSVREAAEDKDEQDGANQAERNQKLRAAEAADRWRVQQDKLLEDRKMLEAKLKQSQVQIEQLRVHILKLQAEMQARAAKAGQQSAAYDAFQQQNGQPGQTRAKFDPFRQKINESLGVRLRKEGVEPGDQNRINELIRRTYLDATGREPDANEWNATREFARAYFEKPEKSLKGGLFGAPDSGDKPLKGGLFGSPDSGAKGGAVRLSAAVGGLRPQLDLVALADSSSDAFAALVTAQEALNSDQAAPDPRIRSAAKAKLMAAEHKARLLRQIAQVALEQAKQELEFARKRIETGASSPSEAIDAEGRVRILSLILQSSPETTANDARRQ